MTAGAGTAHLPGRAALLAVDVGVSTVKMAWAEGGRLVDSSERGNGFPAVVAAVGADLVVGDGAHAASSADQLLDVREWLGYVPSVRLGGRDVRLLDAVAALYRSAAEATVGLERPPPSAIVHPAPWPERRVGMLADAATAAGLDVVAVVPDAVAVAAAGPAEGDVLVIDVGSALTVSVLDTAGARPQILWSGISTGAGGEAIAHAIRAVTDVPVDRARQLARGAPPDTREIPLDWTAIRAQAEAGVAAARELMNDVLRRADRDGAAIWRVYITGGASVAPFVHEAAEHRFGADKVHEFAGPAASAAYGALRLCQPPPDAAVANAWPVREAHRTDGARSTVAPTRAPDARAPEPPPPDQGEVRVVNTWSGTTAAPAGAGSDDLAADWTPAAAPTPAGEPPVDTPRRARRRLRRALFAVLLVVVVGVLAWVILGCSAQGGRSAADPPAVAATGPPPGA